MKKIINVKIKEKDTIEKFNLKEEYLKDFNKSINDIKDLVKLLYFDDIPKYIELNKYISIITKSIQEKLKENEKESNEESNEKESNEKEEFKIICPICNQKELEELYNSKYFGLPIKHFYCSNCNNTFYKRCL